MDTKKYRVHYTIPGRGGGRSAIIDAPDGAAARNMAENMYGNVTSIVHDPSLERPTVSPLSYDDGEHGPLHSIGRSIAREQLGFFGESLSDRAISVSILLVLGMPVIVLWLGFPVYKASLLAPTMGLPPLTLSIATGVGAFCIGWLVLYICPTIILRVVGLVVYAGWFVFYLAGGHFDVDLFRYIFMITVTTNTDATNLHKVGILIAGLAGASVVGGLGKAARGK